MTKVNLIANIDTAHVTVVNHSRWAQLNDTSFSIMKGGNITIPVNWVDGANSTCVSLTAGSATQDGIVLNNVTADTVIEISDAKYKVCMTNSDTEAVDSITPQFQFASAGETASFTISYNSGFDATKIVTDRGTLSGNIISIPVSSMDITGTISKRTVSVAFIHNIPWITSQNHTYILRYGDGLDIPIEYSQNADYTCVTCASSVTGVTIDSNGVHLNNVTSDKYVQLQEGKVQVKAIIDTIRVTSVNYEYLYATKNSSVSFQLTYASGYSGTDVEATEGTISGNTLTVPTGSNHWYVETKMIQPYVRFALGSNYGGTTYYPVYPSYNYSISEHLIPSGDVPYEIRRRQLVGVAFYNRSSTTTIRHIQIGVKTYWYDYFSSNTAWQECSKRYFDGMVEFKANGWTNIYFTTPYTGGFDSAMLIAVNDKSGNITSRPTFAYYIDPSNAYRTLYTYRDNSAFRLDSMWSMPSGTRTTSRTYMQLIYAPDPDV